MIPPRDTMALAWRDAGWDAACPPLRAMLAGAGALVWLAVLAVNWALPL